MRILWLSPYLPAPTFGAGTRVFNLLKALAATCDIDVIAGSVTGEPPQDALAEIRSLCDTVQIVSSRVGSHRYKRLWQFRSLFGRRPMQYSIFHSTEMQDRINRAAVVPYDVIILESSFMGYHTLPDDVPLVLDQHNVESEILLRSSQSERSALRRAYNSLEYWKYRADEQRICRRMDLILAASDRDRETMLTWTDMPACVVIPNGVDTEYFAPFEDARSQGQASVLFTGAMDYSPNVESMLYFVGEIWPLIRQRVPDASLRIVGRAPPPEIVRLAELPGVSVYGSVPDVRPYFAHSQVVVAPLRIGGGTRLKILEAMAMARPVVSTSLGCEGLRALHGRHLLVADEPTGFAASVAGLLDDPDLRAAIGAAGRSLVEDSYDWRALGDRMGEALRELVQLRQRGEGAHLNFRSSADGEPVSPS